MVKVNYEEWIENLYNPNWSGWKDVKYIESTCGKSRAFPDDWLRHSICFLNNYIAEKEVKDILGVDYLTDDHLEWFEGKGENVPDFIDRDTNYTIEFKQTRDGLMLLKDDCNWHNANLRVVYIRDKGMLYYYLSDGTLKPIQPFSPTRYNPYEFEVSDYEI